MRALAAAHALSFYLCVHHRHVSHDDRARGVGRSALERVRERGGPRLAQGRARALHQGDVDVTVGEVGLQGDGAKEVGVDLGGGGRGVGRW